MRCKSCNEALSDYEASIRSVFTREYVSMCKHCLESIKTDVVAVGNINLMSDMDENAEGTEDGLDGSIDIDSIGDDYWNER